MSAQFVQLLGCKLEVVLGDVFCDGFTDFGITLGTLVHTLGTIVCTRGCLLGSFGERIGDLGLLSGFGVAFETPRA